MNKVSNMLETIISGENCQSIRLSRKKLIMRSRPMKIRLIGYKE